MLAEELNEKNEDIRTFLQSRALSLDTTNGSHTNSADAPHATIPGENSTQYGNDDDTALSASMVDIGSTRAFHHNGQILMDSQQLTRISAVGIRSSHFPRTACKPWCSCVCHTESRIQTPQFLQRFLGNLFIGYSGLPVLTKSCNQQTCHMRAQPMSYITYFFPLWFLDRMISLTMTTTPLAGPVVSLKTQRTVPGNADIFTYAKSGNVEELQILFEKGLASPHDVHYESGVTALHASLRWPLFAA